jgi:hypothetical protein
MLTRKLNPVISKDLNRPDTKFDVLDAEQQKYLEEQRKKDLEEQRKKKENTRKYRGSLNGTDALRNLVRAKGSNDYLTISDPSPLTRDYRQGSRKKSSGKRESRSRSKSNSSSVVAEELMSNGSSAIIEKEFENPKVKIKEESKKNLFLPSLANKPSEQTKTPPQTLNAKLPKIGGKRTAKRKHAKKTRGWFW